MLFYLIALDSDYCKFPAQGGVMSAVEGALVLVKGNRVGNLYVLFGNMVTGGVAMFPQMNNTLSQQVFDTCEWVT